MITRYRITLDLTFDDQAKRDAVHAKIKTALANAKTADAWVSGSLNKGEMQQAEGSSESV